jgi:flagellar assembly factor FliW
MSTLTVESSRFGSFEIAAEAVIEFPAGLIGLGGSRFALVSADSEGAFHWLHSVEDPALALPVTNPWLFFSDYVVDLSDADTGRVGSAEPDVWVTVRTGSEPGDFSANLRAPILVADGRGHQVINEAQDAPVRAALFTGDSVERAA